MQIKSKRPNRSNLFIINAENSESSSPLYFFPASGKFSSSTSNLFMSISYRHT